MSKETEKKNSIITTEASEQDKKRMEFIIKELTKIMSNKKTPSKWKA